MQTFCFLAGLCYTSTQVDFPLHSPIKLAGLSSSTVTGWLTFSGGRWTEFPSMYSCAPNSPRVMSQRADLAASSSSRPGRQLSVSTSDRKTDVLRPTASCMGKGRIQSPPRQTPAERRAMISNLACALWRSCS